MEACQAAFDAVAEQLMLTYGVKITKLHKSLRKITKNASKDLPPLQVLYNNTYGGYNYSKEFREFVQAKEATPDSLATLCALRRLQSRTDSDSSSYPKSSSQVDPISEMDSEARIDSSSQVDPTSRTDPEPGIDSNSQVDATSGTDSEARIGARIDSSSQVDPITETDFEARVENSISEMDSESDSECYFGVGADASYENRVRHAQFLVSFGHHVMEKWPGIAKLVEVYMRNDLGHRMNAIGSIAFKRECLRNSLKVSDAIASEAGRTDGKTEYSLFELELASLSTSPFRNGPDYSVYAPSTLKAIRTELDAKQRKCTLAIQEGREALLLHMPEAQYEAMLESYDAKFAEEKLKDASDDYSRDDGHLTSFRDLNRDLSFTDVITKYGERHYGVWQCQNVFYQKAMRFLLLHPEYTEELASQGDNVDCTHKLGLCAASGSCCNLAIAEIPCMAEWAVGQYDGRENVHVV